METIVPVYQLFAFFNCQTQENLIVGMYAMSAIEQTGIRNDAVRAIAEIASKSDYDFTRRYGNYLKDIIR